MEKVLATVLFSALGLKYLVRGCSQDKDLFSKDCISGHLELNVAQLTAEMFYWHFTLFQSEKYF